MENKKSSVTIRSLKRTPFIIALTVLLCVSSVPLQAYGAVSPPLNNNFIASTMQWFRHTFFPTPLYVGTLTGGSTDAGLPNRTDETVTMATSAWTNLVTNLDTGNHLVTVDLLHIPSASGLPLNLQLVHNSMNASVDIGVGKGWMTNVHTCVSEDSGTGDITYLDPSGAQYIFEYDSGSQTYTNPKGFAGQLTKEANGTYSLQTLGHTKYTFNTDGKLSSISETCGTGCVHNFV